MICHSNDTTVMAENNPFHVLLLNIASEEDKVVWAVKQLKNQKSERTQQEIKTKVDPSKLAIGIGKINNIGKGGIAISSVNNNFKEKLKTGKINNIGKGGIAISSVNNNFKEKLKTTVEKELGGNYQIIEPKVRKPQVIVAGVEVEVINQDNENMLKSIID
ncbi:hypothetical protein QE152_g10402 [Popillia japonica]|uniref:Uncharacterized protein n=1 Tax=Popillia japonica TaxID=7064 RepID=A0AAW1LTJ3_POPJA